ncbi:MAG: hypothetical protein EPGJADBJ_00473 [Saprospiraceae bacterium]|nr:hypothetical protein [Saprospiraceae bacterium]
MSYVVPGTCRKEFTPEQARRMRVYLDNSSILENILIKDTEIPGDSPSNPSGNIVVESGEYEVDSTLEMLPDAVIRVKPGATLKVNATITGACDQLWRGVIVEGTQLDLTQNPVYQGQVIVTNTGKVEHARCGIDVQDIDADGPVGGSGGGIVKIISGQIKDNLIGIRFGPYIGASSNKSYFFHPLFSTTDDYRGGAQRPVHLELNTVKGLSIPAGYFRDLRTECEDPAARAIGIDVKNAGFRVSLSSRFENLYKGIRTDQLSELSGSMSVINSLFSQCYKGLELTSSGSFLVYGNEFTVKKPDDCPALPEITGAEIRGNTTGFEFYDNEFASGEAEAPVETLIGTDCIALGEGMGNVIFDNTYSTVFIGNRASGDNGYDNDGLLYLCNKNQNFSTDFLITSGSIRKTQGKTVLSGQTRPTGNTFSGDPTAVCTIVNQGLEIDYYFYDDSLAQEDPGIPGDPNNSCEDLGGFKREPVSQPNGACDETEPPCFPCPEIDVNVWKTSFHQNRQQWIDKKAAFPYITDEEEREAEAEAIRRLRIAMNRDGSRVLMQYSLDTTDIEVDSLIQWLSLIETYPADLRLARHYFFTGNYATFDTLWSQIPFKYELDEGTEDEFERLGEVYDTLRAHLSTGTELEKLPDLTLEILKTWASNCDEPGFLSEIILWRNGIEHSPDCSGGGNRPALAFVPSIGKKEIVKIYPNPANSVLTIEYPTLLSSGRLRLYNTQGLIVNDIELPEQSSSVSTQTRRLMPGLYFVEFHYGQGLTSTQKVVVSH